MPAAEVITSYHDLWRVEQSFRMSKSDLAARPITFDLPNTVHVIQVRYAPLNPNNKPTYGGTWQVA